MNHTEITLVRGHFISALLVGLASEPCPDQSIPCRSDREECVPEDQVCNGVQDCSDGTDEYFCGCKF
jgi:hypothetical protein